jgi:S1-C subfamily serine protease
MLRDSPSVEAGLRPGDVIVGFNGQRVDDAAQLKRMVSDAKIGTSATLRVFRDGRTFDLKVPVQSSASAVRLRNRRG